jgi:hypothetical protein
MEEFERVYTCVGSTFTLLHFYAYRTRSLEGRTLTIQGCRCLAQNGVNQTQHPIIPLARRADRLYYREICGRTRGQIRPTMGQSFGSCLWIWRPARSGGCSGLDEPGT